MASDKQLFFTLHSSPQTSTSLLLTSQCELKHVALMFGHVASLLDYMNSALKSMHEAWEDLLLMMDSKLATYASVSAPPLLCTLC